MTIQELADRAEVTTRTIRYYVEQGVLPPPERGRPAEYTEEHVARLVLIKRLKEQYLPLEEIRDTIQRLSFAEVEALVQQHSPEQTTQKLDTATDYITTVLGRGVAREQMKQAATTTDDRRLTTDNEHESSGTEVLKKEMPRPERVPGEREATDHYSEPVPASPAGFAPAPGSAAVPMPLPAPAQTYPQSHAPSLASRLWSSVVGKGSLQGRRSSEHETDNEESAYIQSPTAWQRVQLGDGIELHYHVSGDARFNERVTRLIEAARHILDREPGNGE